MTEVTLCGSTCRTILFEMSDKRNRHLEEVDRLSVVSVWFPMTELQTVCMHHHSGVMAL